MRPTLCTLLALLCLAPPAARAQAPTGATPPVANAAVPGADFLRSGGPEPDTTAPWRYFPLHVGDAWEYYGYNTGERRRVDVLGAETHEGRDYVTWRSLTYDADGNQVNGFGPVPVRFDTTSALARVFIPELGEESTFSLPWTRCPLDAGFGSEITCPHRPKYTFTVGGGYDGLLAFGGDFPGTGPDTVRTAVKTYYLFDPGNSEDWRYGADLGLVFFEGELGAEGIYYSKVDEVEHGRAFYPVAGEAGPAEPSGALTLALYPNPVRARLTLVVETEAAGPLTIEVLDVLGRVVLRQDAVGAGARVVPLAVGGLRPGVYLVRVRTAEGRAATAKVLKL